MAASSSVHPTTQDSDDLREPDPDDDLRVLFRRPEICVAEARGLVVLVQLTATRNEWLDPIVKACVGCALRHGGPRPLIAVAKLDRRFPIDIGFDQNLIEQRRALDRIRPHVRAFAVVVRFGGILGFTMHRGLQAIGLVAGGDPPMRACSSAAEAVCWIEPYAAASSDGFDRGRALRSLRKLDEILGNED